MRHLEVHRWPVTNGVESLEGLGEEILDVGFVPRSGTLNLRAPVWVPEEGLGILLAPLPEHAIETEAVGFDGQPMIPQPPRRVLDPDSPLLVETVRLEFPRAEDNVPLALGLFVRGPEERIATPDGKSRPYFEQVNLSLHSGEFRFQVRPDNSRI